MIIMLNGAFGTGKTTVAKQLSKVLPKSMLYDPELIGLALSKIIRVDDKGNKLEDFQDLRLWRFLTVKLASLTRFFKNILILPMTIANLNYFREIKSGLTKIDKNLWHFCLTASVDTIYERLTKRGERKESWAFNQTLRCIEAFKSEEYSHFIDTESFSPREIVEIILKTIGFDNKINHAK